MYGISQDNPEVTPPSECRYDVVIPIDDDTEVKRPAMSGGFEGGKYAVFPIKHTKEAVEVFWNNWETVISQNNLSLREMPIIERYKEEEREDKYCKFLMIVL